MQHEEVDYGWPILKAKDIANCLAALEIPMSEQDIVKPNAEKLRQIYVVLLDVVSGTSKEDIEQPDQEALELIEFPELHLDVLSELAFYQALKKLMGAAGVQDFSFSKDFIEPRKNRTIRNLSAIINFLKFREDRLQTYFEMRTESDATLEEKMRLMEINEELTAEKARLQAQAEQNHPLKLALQEETRVLEERVDQLNQQQATLHTKISELKQEKENKKKALELAQKTNANMQRKVQEKKSRIVQSPEKLQQCIREMTENVEASRVEIDEAEKHCRELHSRIDVLGKLEKQLSKTIRWMENAYIEMEKCRDSRSEARELEQRLEESKQKQEEIKEQQALTEEKMAILRERIDRLHEEQAREQAEARSKMSEIERETAEKERERAAIEEKIHKFTEMAVDLENKTRREQEAFEEEKAFLCEQYARLTLTIKEYHTTLYTAMGLQLQS